jgi:uncharacterized protein YjbI with pentapeptide repeats
LIAVANSSVAGDFDGSGLHSESDLFLRYGAVFKKDVTLIGAKVAHNVDMRGVSFEGEFSADSLQVGEMLLMRSEGQYKTSFKGVNLRGAKVTGQVDMRGASFDGFLFADSLQIGEALLMRSEGENKASFDDVNLRGAKVTGQVDMRGASFNGLLFADSLQVGEALLMRSQGENKASFNDVNLCSAKVAGQVDMSGASFNRLLFAESLHVDGDLYLKDARAGGNVIFTFAHAGSMDLRGANLASVNLTGASVGRDFIIGKLQRPSAWAVLNLRNAHVGYLTDASDAWPEQGQLVLDGFGFDHLGAFKDDSTAQTRNLDMEWWDRWAKRDPVYSPAPYTQLAAALKSTGDNDAANEILYFGRERAREAACKKKGMSVDCLGRQFLRWTVGYGIGVYKFYALGWVTFLSVIGAFVLALSVPEARWQNRSWPWCFGASLSRLLPGLELGKEFTQFFDGPFGPRFNWWQNLVFYSIRVAGFVLGAVVIAAFAGLTQGP